MAWGASPLKGYERELCIFFLYDQKKVNVCPRRQTGYIRDYRHDFSLQVVQELLQSPLVSCHLYVEPVNTVLVFQSIQLQHFSRVCYHCMGRITA